LSLFFRAAYLFGFKPWDGDVAPELASFVEQNPPGKSLDIGCGTGTQTVYLAEKGWDATGVDFVPRAINSARTKAARAGVAPRLVVGDVTRLTGLGIGHDFGLLFDKGCFHSIGEDKRAQYVRQAGAVAATGATMLLFGFTRGDRGSPIGPAGLLAGEVKDRFASAWDLTDEQTGQGIAGYSASAWYTLRKR
jgi:SAM-dependent methyltransferase